MDRELLDELEHYLTKVHEHQVLKAAAVARVHNKHLTDEDLLNPDNFPYLISDPKYTYEDGMAAGILAAKIAARAFLLEKVKDE
jgi:hypothetical protein